jgi:hypothetical protein
MTYNCEIIIYNCTKAVLLKLDIMEMRYKNMNMNPSTLMNLMNMKNTFTAAHPKFESFIRTVLLGGGITEGTVIEVTVTKPGEAPVTTNLKVQESDLQMMEELKNITK